MNDAKQKWDDVGDRFTDLARRIKERFDAQAAFGEEDRQKLNEALREIGDALDAGFTALGDSVRDPSMRSELKQAGAAVADALSATFKDVADQIRKVAKRD